MAPQTLSERIQAAVASLPTVWRIVVWVAMLGTIAAMVSVAGLSAGVGLAGTR